MEQDEYYRIVNGAEIRNRRSSKGERLQLVCGQTLPLLVARLCAIRLVGSIMEISAESNSDLVPACAQGSYKEDRATGGVEG